MRCVRPDKLIPAMFTFIQEKIGEAYVSPPPFDLSLTYKDSSQITPLVFVLSPGADPLNSLMKFADLKKKHVDTVSLGQG